MQNFLQLSVNDKLEIYSEAYDAAEELFFVLFLYSFLPTQIPAFLEL